MATRIETTSGESPPGDLARAESLPLRELETGARAALPVLLALDLARVAREEASLLDRRAVARVELLERARNRVPQRARLTGDAAAAHRGPHVVAADHAGHLERRLDHHAQALAREVVLERAAVDAELARAGREHHAGHRGLAASGRGRLLVRQAAGPPASGPRADAPGPHRP